MGPRHIVRGGFLRGTRVRSHRVLAEPKGKIEAGTAVIGGRNPIPVNGLAR